MGKRKGGWVCLGREREGGKREEIMGFSTDGDDRKKATYS